MRITETVGKTSKSHVEKRSFFHVKNITQIILSKAIWGQVLGPEFKAAMGNQRGIPDPKGDPEVVFARAGEMLFLSHFSFLRREFHLCPSLCILVAHENNIFLLSRAKPLISCCPFPISQLHTEVLAVDRFLQQVIFSPLSPSCFASLKHARAREEMKGLRQCQLQGDPGHQ